MLDFEFLENCNCIRRTRNPTLNIQQHTGNKEGPPPLPLTLLTQLFKIEHFFYRSSASKLLHLLQLFPPIQHPPLPYPSLYSPTGIHQPANNTSCKQNPSRPFSSPSSNGILSKPGASPATAVKPLSHSHLAMLTGVSNPDHLVSVVPQAT